MLYVLTIIAILLVILCIVVYQLKQSIKKLPKGLAQIVTEPYKRELNKIMKELESIKNDLGIS